MMVLRQGWTDAFILHTFSPLSIWNHDENKDCWQQQRLLAASHHTSQTLSVSKLQRLSLVMQIMTVTSLHYRAQYTVHTTVHPARAAAPRPRVAWMVTPAAANERASWSPSSQSEARNWHLRDQDDSTLTQEQSASQGGRTHTSISPRVFPKKP